jgi:endonuclease-3
VIQTERDAKKLFPQESWNTLHLQIIFYGRAYSPARNPKKSLDYITEHIGTTAAKNALK